MALPFFIEKSGEDREKGGFFLGSLAAPGFGWVRGKILVRFSQSALRFVSTDDAQACGAEERQATVPFPARAKRKC